MAEDHVFWTVEPSVKTGSWVIRYAGKPTQTAEGRSIPLSFPALLLTTWIEEPEATAKEIARELNAFDDLLAFARNVASIYDESYRPGCLERRLGDEARAALAKAEVK